MAVTVKDVEDVATLARLSFTDEEKVRLVTQLNQILAYMEQLNRLETGDVAPLSHVVELSNIFRDDVLRPSFPREDILKNAPAHTEKFFQVPKVISDR
jgi:aspartyl-tRNA(Asn)/glutamyl-tRNA(Gln) amidotransferase subunit C